MTESTLREQIIRTDRIIQEQAELINNLKDEICQLREVKQQARIPMTYGELETKIDDLVQIVSSLMNQFAMCNESAECWDMMVKHFAVHQARSFCLGRLALHADSDEPRVSGWVTTPEAAVRAACEKKIVLRKDAKPGKYRQKGTRRIIEVPNHEEVLRLAWVWDESDSGWIELESDAELIPLEKDDE